MSAPNDPNPAIPVFDRDRVWLLSWSLYGSRMPGDERGFVGTVRERRADDPDGPRVRHNRVQTEYDCGMSGLVRSARAAMKHPPARLMAADAGPLAEQFAETAAHRGWRILAGAIMPLHVHLLVGVPGDPEPHTLLRDFKSYGSRRLNRGGKRRWWTEGGSTRKKAEREQILAAARYVRDQEGPLSVWVDPDVAEVIGAEPRSGFGVYEGPPRSGG